MSHSAARHWPPCEFTPNSNVGELAIFSIWGEYPIANFKGRGRVSDKMRVILRNRKTGLYYASCDQWVADPARALDFDEIEHAGRLVCEEDLTELEVVLSCDDSTCELALPVRREWRREPAARVAA